MRTEEMEWPYPCWCDRPGTALRGSSLVGLKGTESVGSVTRDPGITLAQGYKGHRWWLPGPTEWTHFPARGLDLCTEARNGTDMSLSKI